MLLHQRNCIFIFLKSSKNVEDFKIIARARLEEIIFSIFLLLVRHRFAFRSEGRKMVIFVFVKVWCLRGVNGTFSWFERVKVWLDLKFVQVLVKIIPQLIQIARNHFRRTAKILNVKVKVFEIVQIFLVGVFVKFEFVEFEMVQLIEIGGNYMRRAERNELNGKYW